MSAASNKPRLEDVLQILRRHTSKLVSIARLEQFQQALLPTFLRNQKAQIGSRGGDGIEHEKTLSPPRRDTDYLDGLRGFAALGVVVNHYFVKIYDSLYYGYGYKDNLHIVQLPILKTLYHGGTLVTIFFIISGFALSSKGIQLIRNRSPSLLTVLSSTTFRRSARLFIPSVISSFIAYLFQRAGLLTDRRPKNYTSTWASETQAYFDYLKKWGNVFYWNPVTGWYNPHLWTIPVEFRCSMVVFLTLLGLSRCQTGVRLFVELAIGIYASVWSRWDIIPFMWGMVLAELHHYRKERIASMLASENTTSWTTIDGILGISPTPSFIRKIVLYTTLTFGMYVGSFPYISGCEAPGFVWMCKADWHSPDSEKWRFITGWGAIFICTSIFLLPNIQRIFTSPFAAYSGKISYALYLTHGTLLRVFAFPLVTRLWRVFGKETSIKKEGVVFSVAILFTFVAFWVADVFERVFDAPAVKFARWIEDSCISNGEDQRGNRGKVGPSPI